MLTPFFHSPVGFYTRSLALVADAFHYVRSDSFTPIPIPDLYIQVYSKTDLA